MVLGELALVNESLVALTKQQEDLLGQKYQLECEIYRQGMLDKR